jgi:hypothetical protein
LLGPSNRYVIRLNGPAVIGDCRGPGDEAEGDAGEKPPAVTAPPSFERAAMILQGPDLQPVSWRVSVWHRPNPLSLRIALLGVEVPLEAELWFKIDASTGLLSRNTVVRHLGGPDVEIAATLAFWYRIHEPIDDVHYLAGAWHRKHRSGTAMAARRSTSRAEQARPASLSSHMWH